MSPANKRRFAVAGGTLPSADEAPGVETSGRQDAGKPPGRTPVPTGRAAYTWRLTPAQAVTMNELTTNLMRELGRAKLDRAELLAELVGQAADNPAVFAALVARMQAHQAS
jgi:hypothetical protein